MGNVLWAGWRATGNVFAPFPLVVLQPSLPFALVPDLTPGACISVGGTLPI